MLANSLKELRASRGMSQAELAEKLGVRQQTVGKWESSVTVPRQPMLQKLADIFGVTTDYLLGRTAEPAKHATSLSEDAVNDIFDDEDLRALARDRLEGATPAEPARPHRKGVKIPVLGRVAAGIPIWAEENIIDWEEISEHQARTGDFFALRVVGQSMEPTIHDGDTLIVRKQEQVENGEVAVVLVNGDEATVKEIHESPAGLTLIGHNAAVYKPTTYTPKEVQDLPVRIIGRVIQSRHDF